MINTNKPYSPVKSIALQPPQTRTVVNLQDFLGGAVFFFGLIPWVSFGTNSLDTQPWTLMVCFLYLSFSARLQINATIKILTTFVFAGILCAVVTSPLNDAFLVLRGVFGYMTFALTLIVVYDFTRRRGVPFKMIVFVNLMYIGFAFLDTVAPAVSNAISSDRTTVGRGVTSLAAEPSFLSIMLFFLSWIILVIKDYRPTKKNILLIGSNVFVIIILAKSALGLLLIVMAVAAAGLYALPKFRLVHFITLISAIIFAVIIVQIIPTFLENSRLAIIFDAVMSRSGLEFVLLDASANSRLQSIVFPMLTAAENLFIPGGFEGYGASVQHQQQKFDSVLVASSSGNIISSWTGAMMYELGFFGVLVLITVAVSGTHFKVMRYIERVLILLTAIHAIPINFPPIAILIVLLLRDWPRPQTVIR